MADAREGQILHSVADLVEAMGSDVLVHFPVDVPPVVTDDTRTRAVCYRALELVTVWPMTVAGLTCLLSGVVQTATKIPALFGG